MMSGAGKKSEPLPEGSSIYFLEKPIQGGSSQKQKGETHTADMQLPMIQNLSFEEADQIQTLSTSKRVTIYSTLSQVHGWLIPTSGYQLCEQIVDIIRCILQLEIIEETLKISTCNNG